MTVVIRELGILQFWIEQRHVLGKFLIAPQATGGSLFWIAIQNFTRFCGGGIFLFGRPHRRCIRFVIPHGGAVERIHKYVGLMHMACHALRRWDRAGEFMFERMSGLILGDGWILGLCFAFVAEFRIRAAMFGVAIICIHRVARCTAR